MRTVIRPHLGVDAGRSQPRVQCSMGEIGCSPVMRGRNFGARLGLGRRA